MGLELADVGAGSRKSLGSLGIVMEGIQWGWIVGIRGAPRRELAIIVGLLGIEVVFGVFRVE